MRKIVYNILIITIYITLLQKFSNNKNEVLNNYEILEYEDAFAKYKNNYIYIGDYSSLCRFEDDNSIIIEDLRCADDPDIKIHNSCKINSIDDMENILNILCEYEKCNPSNWKRTKKSMEMEWICHNLLYKLNYKTYRTKDVDFNNNDEKVYNNKILEKIF